MKKNPAPTLERIKSYEMLRRLVDEGVDDGPAAIVIRLREAGLQVPSRGTVQRWVHKRSSPSTSMRTFEPVPSNELSFFVAAWIGDGWADEADGGKRMRLKVRSRSFAEEFARCASVILSKSKPYCVWTTEDEGGKWYNVKVTSLRLYEFVTRPLTSLKSFISENPEGFLRGFFTAEGCPSINISKLPSESGKKLRLDIAAVVSNCDIELLEYSRDLLSKLGYHPGKVRLNHPKGKKTNLSVASKDNYLVTMGRFDELSAFADEVGFADSEKNAKLHEALELVGEAGSFRAAERWLELYVKVGGKWTRKDSPT